MLPPRSVWLPFLLRFTCILAVYLLPFRPIGNAYGGIAAAVGNLTLGNAPHSGTVLRFAPPDDAGGEDPAPDAFSIELRAKNARTRSPIRVPIDLRTLAYIPTAVFVALSIAAPIWQGARGAIVLIGGLAVLQVFLALSIAAPLVLFFANPAPMHLVDLSPTWHRILDILYRALVAPPGMAFAIPGILWLLMIWLVPARPKASAPTLTEGSAARGGTLAVAFKDT
jgi:hypothetical protein